MTDYQPLLMRALSGLERSTLEGRRSVYERARHALVNQLRTVTPPLAEADITRERLALEEAIRRVEAQVAEQGVAGGQAQAQAKPQSQSQLQPQPQTPAQAQPSAQPQAPAPVRSQAQPAPARAEPVRATAAAPPPVRGGVATRAAPRPREAAVPGGRPAAPQARAPMAAGMEAARRPVGGEPRPPVTGIEFDRMPADQESDLLRPAAPTRPVRPRGEEVARADRRKAVRAKLVVMGIVAILVAVAGALGYMHRERILAFFHMGSTMIADGERSKALDRVASDPSAQVRQVQPGQPAGSVATVAQRAVLYEENPGGSPQQQQQLFVGTAAWRTETVTLGPGRAPEIGVRVDVEIPDRRMNVVMTIRRNPDTTLPASHTIEIQFSAPGDAFGGVASMPGVRAKSAEAAQGAPLAGLVVRVTPGFFLVGLSNLPADRERNITLLRERAWIDIPFVYNNGRRAVIAVEKGTPGERAINDALAAWGQ
jgi:hypothetical protein